MAYGQEDEYLSQDMYQPQDNYLLAQYQQSSVAPQPMQYRQQQQQQRSQDDVDGGSTIMGKKRSKTQPSAPHPPEFLPPSTTVAYNGFDSYGDYSTGGYISPPFNNDPSPPPIAVSSIFKTDIKSEQQDQTKSSSRWMPFGKKKSKSFSHNEQQPSGPYVPPNDYEIPVPSISSSVQQSFEPLQARDQGAPDHLQHHLDNLNESFEAHHTDWFVTESDSPQADNTEYDESNRYYDEDEDQDVDPYYIADTKGRAHAFEGKVNNSSAQAIQLTLYVPLLSAWS
jgi:hypothetical protein